MDKKIFLGGLLAAVSVAGIAGAVDAYRGDFSVKGPNWSEERHAAMTQAFQDNDYAKWKELMDGRGRVSNVVNEGNFARFAEARRLALEGKTEQAKKIRAELGLGLQNGSGSGERHMNRHQLHR